MKKNIKKNSDKYIMNTYNRLPIVIERGKGVWLYDEDGKKYLDFVAGIAVNILGYKNKKFIKALTAQAKRFNHCSNLYYNKPQTELAEILVENSCFDKVFFCNSGAEAVEAALKLSRKYGDEKRTEIIAMKNSFHGRTFGAISVTGQAKYQKGLSPLLPDILHADLNDIQSVKKLVNKKTCAILVEPIQGEGGVICADKEFLQELRQLCTKNDILLIVDEVQSGIGRTGKLFAYEHYGIEPDIICLAKGLGNGFPIGAMMAKENVACAFSAGDHASTFGGNPLATTCGKVVLDELLKNKLLENAEKSGQYLIKKLNELKEKYPEIKDVRGLGLLAGVEFNSPVKEIVENCQKRGLLLIGAGLNVIRFVPPLIVSFKEINQAISIFETVLREAYSVR